MSRKLKYKDVDFTKIKVAEYLSEPEKVYLYDIAHPEDKLNLAIVLWDDSVDNALNLYQTSREDYYDYFAQKFKKSQVNKLKFFKIKADLVYQNPEMLDEDIDRQAKVIYNKTKENANASNANPNNDTNQSST